MIRNRSITIAHSKKKFKAVIGGILVLQSVNECEKEDIILMIIEGFNISTCRLLNLKTGQLFKDDFYNLEDVNNAESVDDLINVFGLDSYMHHTRIQYLGLEYEMFITLENE